VSFDDSDIYAGTRKITDVFVKKPVKESAEPDATNEPRFSYSIYAKTVRKVLSEFDDYLMQKSPKNGMFELRSAIAWYLLRSRRLKVSPDQIVIGAGAEYLYGLIVQTFGRDVLYGVESPSYQKIAKVYSAGGARLGMLKLGHDGIESDELWNSDVKILHITPYRSFPSGVTASASKKREYLKWSRKNDGYIIEDDFESEFTPSRKPEETIFSLDEEGRVIYVNTFTRTIGSYVRCAYMVLPTNLTELFNNSIGFYECPVPTLDQLVVASLIDSGDFERHINRVRRYNRNK
jgi:GntR family transcriptional regulator/MocR family aminotransferase